MTSIRRPDLHSLIHKPSSNPRKRPREDLPQVEPEKSEEEEWDSDDETSDESDYSVYSDEDDDDEHSLLE